MNTLPNTRNLITHIRLARLLTGHCFLFVFFSFSNSLLGAAAAEADGEEGDDERAGNDDDDDVGQVGGEPPGSAGVLALAFGRFNRLPVAFAHVNLL